MDKLWRLLVAVFFLLAAVLLLMLAYLFENTVFAIVCVYGTLILGLVGAVKGIFVMIDHHRENKEE